ncbi:50S ribosomal protein L29 [bacterium]|nr:50S ribosomal protein L29 [bacterium]
MKVSELRTMTKDELIHHRDQLVEEWFNLRMQSAIKPLDNPKRIRQIRKDIARINTILHEDELGIRKIVAETETGT